MRLARLAEEALSRDRGTKARWLFTQAWRYEEQAIGWLTPQDQPTWSVLHRSAATLALESNHPRDAQRLAMAGLVDGTPDEIASELREALDLALTRTVARVHA